MNPETEQRISDAELVHRQLLCVKYLCETAAAYAEGMAVMIPKFTTDPAFGHHVIKMNGGRAHAFMEWVGDWLNGMDCNSEEDDKWSKTFRDARERWKNLTDELNGRYQPQLPTEITAGEVTGGKQ